MRDTKESIILKACLQLLTLHGAFVFRVNSGAVVSEYKGKRRFMRFNSAPGCSDILGILPGGTFLACEVKRPGQKLTEKQQAFLDAVRKKGGVGLWVSSVQELEDSLVELGHA